MRVLDSTLCVLAAATCLNIAPDRASNPKAADLASDLRQISLDPKHTWRVRDLKLERGDLKIYLNEGVLSFFTPIDAHVLAAVFTTQGTEAGDAEVILFPPNRSERASLASFAKTPNMDEHFTSSVFFFTDNTAQELLDQINRAPVREAPDLTANFALSADPVAREIAGQIDVPLIQALLDRHGPTDGLFYGVVAGRTLGTFDINYDPMQAESIFVGRILQAPTSHFQLWTNFRGRHEPPFVEPEPRVHTYRIDSTIHPDLTMDVSATFQVKTSAQDGRVIPLSLSPRLKVASATIDNLPAEVFQHPSERLTQFGTSETFLLVADRPFAPAVDHEVRLHYAGSVIRRTSSGDYFVDDRNTWYPVEGPVRADFDLTFHCPERLRLVSTGEPVSEKVEGGNRTVHRKTITPEALAGFNLGDYTVREEQHNSYSLQIDSPHTASAALVEDPSLPAQTASILDDYTRRWIPLPIHSLAVTPIAGYFGQGFPGLIYLSNVSFIKEQNRSTALRGSRFDAFFSELLLPHEIAHQWWGNIVRPAGYRSDWITEAMANDSALEHIERTRGREARDEILESYRQDLTKMKDGKTVESAGPLSFGERLIDTYGLDTWHVILYEKGSWIMHMLRERLGTENFRQMQLRLLSEYGPRPLSNEDLRQLASKFVPAGKPDKTLTNFFDTWIYGTGIPSLSLRMNGRNGSLNLAGVEDDFIAEIPLRCKGAPVYWVRAGAGSNPFQVPEGASSCELPAPRDFLYTR